VGQLEKETSMSNMYFEDHPTDPDKVILRKPRHEDDDDIQEYKRPWVGLTNAEIEDCFDDEHLVHARNIERLLKDKNT
jgi:hypothetical protein